MIDRKLYWQQLANLKAALQVSRSEKRKVRLLHNNARAHMGKVPGQKLEESGQEALSHPPYSPDLVLSDHYRFRSLRNHLITKHFDDEADLKSNFEAFFSPLPENSLKMGLWICLKDEIMLQITTMHILLINDSLFQQNLETLKRKVIGRNFASTRYNVLLHMNMKHD